MIKEAIISDYEIIEEIISDNYEFKLLEEETNTIREALTNYNKVVYIDYENEIPVAYAQCSLKNEANMVGYLEKIYIKHNYQNKGIDKKLLHLRIHLYKHFCRKLFWKDSENNRRLFGSKLLKKLSYISRLCFKKQFSEFKILFAFGKFKCLINS